MTSSNKRVVFYQAAEREKPTNNYIDDLNDGTLDDHIGKDKADTLRDELELLGALDPFDPEAFARGEQTPFFGSAINNFGVQELLDKLLSI